MYGYTGSTPVPLLFVYCAVANQYLLSKGLCYTLIIFLKRKEKRGGGKEEKIGKKERKREKEREFLKKNFKKGGNFFLNSRKKIRKE